MRLRQLVRKNRAKILALAERRGVTNLRVFGSVGRGEDTKHSDLDLLVDLKRGRSLLDLGGLLMDLQELLGCKVDLVTEGGLHWYIRDKIVREARPL
jgi:predicted nucleotidyltransferase